MERGGFGVRGWMAVSGALLFAAGASLGYLGANWSRGEPTDEVAFADPVQVGPILGPTNSEVYDRLGLGPDQRALADEILSDAFTRIRRLREEREALAAKVEADLLALLDEGQREKMKYILREIKIVEVAGMVSEQLARYKGELSLGPGEEKELFNALIEFQVAWGNLVRTQNPWRPGSDRVKFGKDVGRLQEELLSKAEKFLTKEQFAKFKAMREGERHGPGANRGGRRPATRGTRSDDGNEKGTDARKTPSPEQQGRAPAPRAPHPSATSAVA